MRFPSKALLIFVLSTAIAHADEGSARYLSLSQAREAFGPEFSLENMDGAFTLFGGTSEACLTSFDIKNDPKKGEFSILYKGDNDGCLKFTDTVKDLPRGGFRSLADLPDAKMKPEGTFDSAKLVSENAYSSKNPWNREDLKSDKDEFLSNVSAADFAKLKKDEEAKKKQAQVDMDLLLVSKCHRGLPELDLGSDALARLAKIDEVVRDKGDEWFADSAKKFRDETFSACQKQILKARTDQIASAKCEDRLKKLAGEDEQYVSKIKSLYFDLANRYTNSTTMEVEDAYQASMDTLEKIREYDITEEDEQKILGMQRNIQFAFLRRAAAQGSESEAFKFMKGKMLDYMVENDAEGCLDQDTGMVLSMQRMNRACSGAMAMSIALGQQIVAANGKQMLLNQQARELADRDACANLRSSGMALQPFEEAKCKAIETADAEKASAAANGSLSNAASGFGEAVKTPRPETPDATAGASAGSESGLLNTGYTAEQGAAPMNTAAQTPATNVAAPSGQRRIFR